MTQDEIIEMAIQAGIPSANVPSLAFGRVETGIELLEAFAKLVAEKAIAKERKDAWEVVNALIVKGHIGGNGVDPTAERNGIILATNALMERIARGQA